MAAKASAKSSKKDPVCAPPEQRDRSRAKGSKRKLAVAAAVEPPPKQLTLEERWASLEERLAKAEPEFQRAYQESLDMSWIYHDSALEGSVYTPHRAALGGRRPTRRRRPSRSGPTRASSRSAKRSAGTARRSTTSATTRPKKRMPITIDVVKKIYLILHPEEGDIKTVKYRKDIPQHRLYFHEYAPPDKITYKVRQILDWIERSRDAPHPQRRPHRGARALRSPPRVPVHDGQRQGRAPLHEPPAPAERVSRRPSSTRRSASAITRRSRARARS